MSLQLAVALGVRQTCSVDMVQYAALMSLGVEELEDTVRAAVSENPLLEAVSEPCDRCGWMGCTGCPTGLRAVSPTGGTIVGEDALPGGVDPRHAVRQRARLELAPGPAAVVAVLVEHCDERGILSRPVVDITRDLELDDADVRRALDWLRREVAPTAAADDLLDAVCLQIGALPRCPAGELAERLLRSHPDSLTVAGRDGVAMKLGVTPLAVDEALDFIRSHLEPYPSVFPTENVYTGRPRPPDVAVSIDPVDNGLVFDLADDRCRVRVRPDVEHVPLRDRSPEFRRQLDLARSLASRLGRRRSTLRAIVECAVHRRSAQVTGNPALTDEPLTRALVAEIVGVHESTVSRAVSGRVLRRPDGSVIALASLFDRSVDPKSAIAELVDAETTPLSDQALSARLADRGHDVSRRTVAKYRAELGIPASSARAPKSAAV